LLFDIDSEIIRGMSSFQFETPARALSPGARIAVVGGGIVGACAALTLTRAGFKVSLFEKAELGGGASFGNAGLISVDSCIPVALPGTLQQIPKWIFNSAGPLSLRWQDFPGALPWLLQRITHTGMEQVRACSAAMRALHAPALDLYRDLLGADFSQLIQTLGQLHVWDSDAVSQGEQIERELRASHGIETREVAKAEIQAWLPELSTSVVRGTFFPNHAHTVNPQALVAALVGLHAGAGGQVVRDEVRALSKRGDQLYVRGDAAQFPFDAVIVATGIEANALLAPLALRIPLVAERGYHLRMQMPWRGCAMPVVHRSRNIVVTPMQDEIRVTGFVEISRHDRAPDPRKIAALQTHAQAVFPNMPWHAPSASWVGSRPSTPDNLPVIDASAAQQGIYLACGHSHFGFTGAGMTAQLLRDLITAAPPTIDPQPYRLSRFA
jgi:glycine/D-amino acid oxidase-like deaminating enzyme